MHLCSHNLKIGIYSDSAIFLSFFLLFCLIFISGSIKIDKFSVPTDQLVDSTIKLIDTSKQLALHPKELNSVKSAPQGSLLERLSKKDILLVDGLDGLDRIKAEINDFVIFGDQTRAIYL